MQHGCSLCHGSLTLDAADSGRYSADQSGACDTSPDSQPSSSNMLLGSEQSSVGSPLDERTDDIPMGATLPPDHLNKPLPYPPPKRNGRMLPTRARLALAAVSTNLKVRKDVSSNAGTSSSARKGPAVSVSKPSPLLVRDTSSFSLSGLDSSTQPFATDDGYIQPITNSRDAAMLSKRIEALAAQHEHRLRQKGISGPTLDGSQSRFQKSKEALGRVKEAIHRRLTGNTDQDIDAKRSDLLLMGRNSEDLSSLDGEGYSAGSKTGPKPGVRQCHTPAKHIIPRKPIRTTEGEVCNEDSEAFSFLEDPFSDICDLELSGQPSIRREGSSKSGLSSNLNPFRAWRNDEQPRGRPLRRSPTQRDGYTFTNLLGSSADTIPRQTAPAADLLSSSPEEYTTPRLRLEPKVEPDGMTKLMSVRSDRSNTLGTFSFEKDHETENIWDQSDHDNQPGNDPPGTLKRKSSGKRDLETSPTPAHKKVKQQVSGQDENLAASMAELEMPLPSRDPIRPAKALLRRFNRVRGMSMFDVRDSSGQSEGAWVKL